MTGETDLGRLLRAMEPVLHPDPWGYASLAGPLPAGLVPFATVAEAEGLTVVAPQSGLAAAGVDPGPPFARISLSVHSALSAVGLTAAVAAALAARGISANVVAGYFHDHLFLPWDRRTEALAALGALARGQGG